MAITAQIGGQEIFALGDMGGYAGTNTSFTNVTQVNSGAGINTLQSSDATTHTATTYLKFHIGTTAYWVPAFLAI